MKSLDISLFYFFNHTLQFRGLIPFYQFVSGSNEYLFIILALLLFRDKKWTGTLKVICIAIFAVAVSDLTGFLLKELIARPRPCHVLEDVRLIAYCGKSFSMPSNHGVNAFAFAGTIFFFSKDRIRYAFLALAALVALSRPVVGVHYPSDAAVGAAVGLLMAWLINYTYTRVAGLSGDRRTKAILGIALFAMVAYRLYYITHSPLELSPHEASLWGLLRSPDSVTHTPLTWWLVSISSSIFGNTFLGVRSFAVIFSALTSILVYALGRDMYDSRTGLFAALSYQFIPLFAAHGILMTSADLFTFFWALALYLFYRGLKTEKATLWGALGVVVALGALSDVRMLLFPLLAAGWALTAKAVKKPDMRGPVAFIFTFLLVFSPFLAMRLVLKGSEPLGLYEMGVFEFTLAQVGTFTPVLFALACLSIFRKSGDPMRTFILWFSAPIFLTGLVMGILGSLTFSAVLPAYITALIALSRDWFKGLDEFALKKKILVMVAIGLALITGIVAHYPVDAGIPSKLDPSSRLKGWHELSVDAASALNHPVPDQLRHNAIILTDSKEIASELEFYLQGETPVRLYPQALDVSYVGRDAVFVAEKGSINIELLKKSFSECDERKHIARDEDDTPLRMYVILNCREYSGR